ncbi:MAG: outer membrane protein assembly factor BamB, partial [Gammaproteobacteria bacterium]|nr:outer membrane protein assembly factor BamB [Gammaproteobacteria bacterium]
MRYPGLFVIVAMAALLGACSSKPVRVPTPIEPINASFTPELLWETQVGSGIGEYYLRLMPAVGDKILYVADHSGTLAALEQSTGERLWQVDLELPITGGVGIGAARLFVTTREGRVVALSTDDGHQLWESLVSTEVLSVPVNAGSHVLVHTTDGKLFALDSSTGRVQWTYDRSVPVLNLRGTSTPVVAQGVVFDTFSSGKLAVMQLQTGKVLLEQAMAIPQGRSDLERMIDADAGPLLDGNVVYVATYQGRIVALNLQTGRQLWERKASVYQPMAIDDKYLYVTDADDAIVAYDKRSGSPVWRN